MRLYPLLIAVLLVGSGCEQDAEIVGPSPQTTIDTLPAPNLEPNGSFRAGGWRIPGPGVAGWWMPLGRKYCHCCGCWVTYLPVHQDGCEVDGIFGSRRYYVYVQPLELLADSGRFTLSYHMVDICSIARERDTTEVLVSGVLEVSGEGLATELTLVPDDPSQSPIHGYMTTNGRCWTDCYERPCEYRWGVDLEYRKSNGLAFKFSLGFKVDGGPYRCIRR